jgi:uncharacterized protein
MRVVIDTNIFVSSFFGGKPRKVIDLWFSGELILCLSKQILEEYFEVLGRFDFDDDTLLIKLMSAIENNSNILFVENPEEKQWINEDPKDDKFIACALALKAGYIVSGDSHLTIRKEIENIKILTPSEILEFI